MPAAGIRLIAGLGNPGPQYEATRHNVGFWFVEAVASAYQGHFRPELKFHGLACRVVLGGADLRLLKPTTYMNRSGQSLGAMVRYLGINPEEILVVHDELDLPPGGVRVKQGGGAGGHNGIKDIQAQLSTPDFWRLRLGVGHPRNLNLAQDVADFVLHRPRADERAEIDRAIDRCLLAWPKLATGDYAAAQQQLHGKAV